MASIAKAKHISKSTGIKRIRPVVSLVSILIALILGTILMALMGINWIDFFSMLFIGNFGSINAFGDFLGNLMWLLILGASLMVSFRAGIFNIGSAGQFALAGVTAFWLGGILNAGGMGPMLIMFIAMFVGAAAAFTIGVLKTKFGIHEVVTSIMFNWIIFYSAIMIMSSTGSLLEANNMNIAWLSSLFGNSIKINTSIFFVPLIIAGLWFLYRFTTFGFKQDIIGSNPSAAEAIGLNKDKELLKTFALSGMLAGLAGAIFTLGVQDAFAGSETWVEIPGIAFNGITIALLGVNSAVGIVFSSIFVSMFETTSLITGTVTKQIPIGTLILAFSLFFVALGEVFIKYRAHEDFFRWLEKEPSVSSNKNATKTSSNNVKEIAKPKTTKPKSSNSKTTTKKTKPKAKKGNK